MRLGLPGAVLIAGASVLIGLTVPAIAADTGSSALAGSADRGSAFPHMDHVFVIMMENTSYADLLNPSNTNTTFIQSLASTYGLETDYFGVTHVSLPNYVAATSGNTWGSNSDDEAQANDGFFNHLSLTDQLNRAGVSWKGYMESMPSVGYTGNFGDCTSNGSPDPTCTAGGDTGTALYVRKHDPFMQYPDVFTNSQQAANVVPLTQLTSDLNSGDAPQFVWITPNECSDMHGGPPQCPFPSVNSITDPAQETLFRDGDNFLNTWVTAIMNSKAWTGNSAIFVTWDEGGFDNAPPFQPLDDSGCCDSPRLPATPVNPSTGGGGDLHGGTLYGGGHVPMIVIARHGARAATDATPGNHYSLLQTIELNWGLALLGNAGDTLQVQSLAALLAH